MTPAFRIRVLICLAASLLAYFRAAAAEPKALVPGEHQLFIDDALVDKTVGLHQSMHTPDKRGAVLTPDRAGGETMIQSRTAPMWIAAENRYRMVYIAVWEGRWQPMVAESEDGIHWTRPDFGRQGVKPANKLLVKTSAHQWDDVGNVVFDPDDADPARRYKAITGDTNRLPAVSPDCRDFTLIEIPPLTSGDESQLAYDRGRRQFIASMKTFTPRGRSVGISTSTDFNSWTPVATVFTSDDVDQQQARGVIKRRISDKGLMPLASVDPEPPADYVPKPTTLATWACDVYNMAIFPYAGGYIGLPAIFYRTGLDANRTNTDGFHDIQLAFSRDLHHWQRLGDRKPFIGASRIDKNLLGVYDRTQLLPTSAPIERGDELWFYYTGLKWRDSPYELHRDMTPRPRSEWKPQEIADFEEGSGAVCLAVLRRDGFISLDASAQPGFVLTKPLVLSGRELQLNVAASEGQATVEICSPGGAPLPGFASSECLPVTGDAVAAPVRWNSGADLSTLRGQTVQIKIQLQKASLYAFWTTK